MRYSIFSENQWLYPDSDITAKTQADLHAPRNSDVCFQILTDLTLVGGEKIEFSFNAEGCNAELYQLLPLRVTENSDPVLYTTTDYESAKDFVTRQAPFDVYEVTRPLDDGVLSEGRLALYVRINVARDAEVGVRETVLGIKVKGETLSVPLSITAYSVQIPTLSDAEFHMANWISYTSTASAHGVEIMSEKYKAILKKYCENQVDMRSDYLMLPGGTPIKDDSGRIVDFDFSHAEFVGNLALKCGYNKIMGGFVARWNDWREPELYLVWDEEVDSSSIEGYRQLKVYFDGVLKCIERNGWADVYMQCLVDEPQFPSSLTYRALSGICRRCIPGVVIHDPVETTEIGGALDVWVIKQALYEKHYENFKKLQDMGEEMWIYTCGFPSGKTMNRILDLPLTVSRLPMWMCYKYGCPGFLHWGYNVYDPAKDPDTHFRTRKGKLQPAGNAFIVVPGDDRPWYGVRAHAQRLGAYDWELLNILGKRDKKKALGLIDRVCRTFDDYDSSATLLDEIRKELLRAIR